MLLAMYQRLSAALSFTARRSQPSLQVPHGVEPKALVVGGWLVLIGGREGLFLYATPAAGLDACGLPSTTWQRFNIAAHHN